MLVCLQILETTPTVERAERPAGLVGLTLLAVFVAPYLIKLMHIDITLAQFGGLALTNYAWYWPR